MAFGKAFASCYNSGRYWRGRIVGLVRAIGNRILRKGSRVQIPPSPLDCQFLTFSAKLMVYGWWLLTQPPSGL